MLTSNVTQKTINQSQYDSLKKQLSGFGYDTEDKLKKYMTDNKIVLKTDTPKVDTPVITPKVDTKVDTKKDTPVIDTNNNNTNNSVLNNSKTNNVGINEYNKSVDSYKDNAGDYAKGINKVETDAGNKANDLTIERNKEARSDNQEQEKKLEELTAEYKEASEERRAEIEKIVANQKAMAGRQANIAVALTGANGYNLSESERDNLRNDILSKYASNITEAETNALTQNRNIDNDLKELGFSELAKQSDINALKEKLTNEEYAPLLNAIDLAKAGDVKATEDIYNFIASGVKAQSDEELQRGLSTKRETDNRTQYANSTNAEKLSMIGSMLYQEPGFADLGAKVQSVIESNPNASFDQVVAQIKQMASSINQKNILSNTIAQKAYKDLSQAEQKVIDGVLNKTIDIKQAIAQWGNTTNNGNMSTTDDLFKNISSKYKDAVIKDGKVYATKDGATHSWTIEKGNAVDLGVVTTNKTENTATTTIKKTKMKYTQAKELAEKLKKQGNTNQQIENYFKENNYIVIKD